MNINTTTYFDRLGISYNATKESLDEITDELVEEAYCDSIIELYIKLQEGEIPQIRHKTDEEKEKIEDNLKQRLHQQLTNMITKAKRIVIENMIDEYGKTKSQKENIAILKGMYKTAYEELETKEKRMQYAETLSDKKELINTLQNIIANDGGDINQEIENKKIREGNFAKEVKKISMPQYDVIYEDENMKLLHKSTITFNNGGFFQDELNEYFMYKERNKIIKGCSFYANIEMESMENPKYRVALCQAVIQDLMEENGYIGSIEKGENGYYILKDAGQESAVKIYEEQQAEERRKSIKLKEQEKKQGEDR